MGNSHKSSKTKETTEASGEKNTTNGSKVKRKKACLSCLKSRTSDAADDAAENNSTTQTKTEEKKSDAVCLPAAEASKATKETPISADFRGKETATQAVSNRGSTYDNIRSNEKTEAAEIHKAQTSESNEMKNDHEFTQKDIHDTEKPKETRLGGCQLSSHVPAPAASTAQPFCNVNSASNAGHLVKNDTEAAFEYKIDRPIKTFHVPDQHHQLLPSDKHHAQLSYKQESVPRQKAKMVNDNTEKTHPENWSTCPEGSNEMRQEHFTNETKPVNDDAEEHASSSSSTASTVQTSNEPTQKVSDYSTAIDEEIECSKTKKAKVTSKKIKNSRQPDTRRPVGLQNLGNTCFFNAVMQNLNQSFALFQLLKEEASDQLPLTKSMNRFYYQMCSGNSSTVTPSDVLQNICRRSPRFRGGRQQDSHELLRHLLDGLRNEERESLGNPNNRKVLTKVDKVFGGHFMTVYTCKDCKTPYHVCEPMLDISLPIAYENFEKDEESNTSAEENETAGDNAVYQKAAKSLMTPLVEKQKEDVEDSRSELGSQGEPQQSNRKRKKKNKKSKIAQSRTNGRSILDCLDAFTRTEHIADEYLCMACHAQRVNEGATDYQMTSATKRTLIYNPPALLTLHLKRFEQTQYGFVKCNNGIAFHDMIDVGPYCSSWCMRNAEQERNIWYSLYGLVVHGGSLDGGHYVAYVKLRERRDYIRQFLQESYLDRDQLTEAKLVQLMQAMHDLSQQAQTEKWQPQPVKGSWFYVSDSHFSPVPEQEVWRQQAYLLFYERIGKNRSICYQRCIAGKTETSV